MSKIFYQVQNFLQGVQTSFRSENVRATENIIWENFGEKNRQIEERSALLSKNVNKLLRFFYNFFEIPKLGWTPCIIKVDKDLRYVSNPVEFPTKKRCRKSGFTLLFEVSARVHDNNNFQKFGNF